MLGNLVPCATHLLPHAIFFRLERGEARTDLKNPGPRNHGPGNHATRSRGLRSRKPESQRKTWRPETDSKTKDKLRIQRQTWDPRTDLKTKFKSDSMPNGPVHAGSESEGGNDIQPSQVTLRLSIIHPEENMSAITSSNCRYSPNPLRLLSTFSSPHPAISLPGCQVACQRWLG